MNLHSSGRRLGLCLAAGLFLAQNTGGLVLAQSAVKSSGTTIAPALQEITILPHATTEHLDFSVRNDDVVQHDFTLKAVNMGALDSSGGVIFSGLGDDFVRTYGLARWIHLEQTNISLAAKSTVRVPLTIVNDDELQPGGHYGAVVVSLADQVAPASDKSIVVNLTSQVAALFFVKKLGGETYRIALDKLTYTTGVFGLSKQATIRFANKGNIHVVPRGVVRVISGTGHEIARGAINAESSIILPGHSRDFVVPLRIYSGRLFPGTYHLVADYRFDGIDNFQTYQQSFRYLNIPLLSEVIFVTTGYVVLFVWFFRKYSYRMGQFFRRLPKRMGARRNKKYHVLPQNTQDAQKLASSHKMVDIWPTHRSGKSQPNTLVVKKKK